MKNFFTLILLLTIIAFAKAQQSEIPTTEPYGKVDKADLEMTSCDVEKDANAEVLFDQGSVTFTPRYELVYERHTRIKIFNDKGNDWANVKFIYYGGYGIQTMSDLQAETIGSKNGVLEITKVDKKQIFIKQIDKLVTEVSFAFPNVKPGSIVEYKYATITAFQGFFPKWMFQDEIPTRYSEFKTDVPVGINYRSLVMVTLPFVKNTDQVKALANIPSVRREPYMNSVEDNSQRIYYVLQSFNLRADMRNFSTSWKKVAEDEGLADDFGRQIHRKLSGEDVILNNAKRLNTQAEKIAYIFNEVRNDMKWNDVDVSYTYDGTSESWNKKTGNSTEINLVVCHLLQKAGINALPMLVSTRKNGRVNPAFPTRYRFNRTVTYVPIDSANYYVLDATSKYNLYNEVPVDLLNTFGFYVDDPNSAFDMVFLQRTSPIRQLILINAEVNPDGKMTGTAQFRSFDYHRMDVVEKYKTVGEEKYIDFLRNGDNNLKITSIKFENMEIDSLPLTQNVDFSLNTSGSDEHYIYINPSVLTGLSDNPFSTEKRVTDIDFKYCSLYSINGIYKIPAGFKIDALPKSASMAMSDKSISFRRVVGEQDGSVVVRYTISYQKSVFFKEDYPELYEFYKKMHEMLIEPIVLKKA